MVGNCRTVLTSVLDTVRYSDVGGGEEVFSYQVLDFVGVFRRWCWIPLDFPHRYLGRSEKYEVSLTGNEI
jgi:hypothetical protein